MDKFIVYILIGGLLAGFIDKSYVERCGKHIPTQDMVMIITLYPAVFVAAAITESTGDDICHEPRGEK